MILVVDDHQPTRDALATILRSKGYDARTAPSGHAALTLIEELRPSLVLLDVQMKDMSGLDVLQKLQSDPELKRLNVIVFTGDRSAKAHALEAGATACVIKSKEAMEGFWEQIAKYAGDSEQNLA